MLLIAPHARSHPPTTPTLLHHALHHALCILLSMASGAPAAHPQQPPRPNFSRSHREPAREKHHLADGGMAVPQSTRSTRFLDQRALLTDVKQSQLKQSQLQFQRSQNQHAMPQLQQSQGGPLKGNDAYQNYQKTVPVYAQSQGGGHARGPGIGQQQQQQKGPQSYQGGIQQPGGEDAFQAGMQQPLGGEGGEEGILSFFDQLVEEQRDEITDAVRFLPSKIFNSSPPSRLSRS